MTANTYQPGDKVFIIDHRGRIRTRTTITAVKQYKRDAKVTDANGQEWSALRGCSWSTRGESRYGGSQIVPWSAECQAELDNHKRLNAVQRCVYNWAQLTDAQRQALGDLAKTICAEQVAAEQAKA